jgi:DNA repair ATPase RecN
MQKILRHFICFLPDTKTVIISKLLDKVHSHNRLLQLCKNKYEVLKEKNKNYRNKISALLKEQKRATEDESQLQHVREKWKKLYNLRYVIPA